MFEHLHDQLIANAKSEAPNEMCGYIVRDESDIFFYKAENIIPHNPKQGLSPTEAFAIDIQERAHVESLGEILAVVHSHTNCSIILGKNDFSTVDRAACNRGSIPWVLVTLPTEEIKVLQPNPDEKIPLLGRSFHMGVFDCFTIVKDGMAEAGIVLNDYPRYQVGEWDDDPDWNLYEDNFKKEGFIEIDRFSKLQKYDLLLMSFASRRGVINHAGLIWDVNRNIFIHHLVNRFSEETVYGGYWDKHTITIARHKDLF